MGIYNTYNIGKLINGNPYVGRGIVIGKTADGKKAVFGYFIMGRSENSRNRIFELTDDGIRTRAFDESKLEDPSLIIYNPVRKLGDKIIVTNGDQTDTIYNFLKEGKSFADALKTREFEPDPPNFTPRISGIIELLGNDFAYEMSILKSIDEVGSDCARYNFSYPAKSGLGHFIHTYNTDGNPIPTFTGEPERVEIPADIDTFTNTIWDNLDENNKISLYTSYIDIETGESETRLINKNK